MLLILLLTLPLQLPNLYLQHAGWFSWDGIQIHHPLSGTGLLHPAYLLWTITYKNRGAFEKKFFELWFTWMDGGVRDSGYSCSNLARDQDVCIGDLQARLTLMRCEFSAILTRLRCKSSLRIHYVFVANLLRFYWNELSFWEVTAISVWPIEPKLPVLFLVFVECVESVEEELEGTNSHICEPSMRFKNDLHWCLWRLNSQRSKFTQDPFFIASHS